MWIIKIVWEPQEIMFVCSIFYLVKRDIYQSVDIIAKYTIKSNNTTRTINSAVFIGPVVYTVSVWFHSIAPGLTILESCMNVSLFCPFCRHGMNLPLCDYFTVWEWQLLYHLIAFGWKVSKHISQKCLTIPSISELQRLAVFVLCSWLTEHVLYFYSVP